MTLSAADLNEIREMTQTQITESIKNLTRGTGGTVIPTPIVRAATISGPVIPGGSVLVRADGDTTPVPATNATGRWIGSGWRVLVSWIPPHGVYITGMLTTNQPSGRELIARQLLTLPAANIVFQNIPQNFKDLHITAAARCTGAATVILYTRFNGDTGTNYFWSVIAQINNGAPGTFFGSSTAEGFRAGDASSNAGGRTSVSIGVVPGYSRSDMFKTYTGTATTFDASSNEHYTAAGWWANTNAVTQVEFRPQTGSTLGAGTEIAIYGEY